MCPCSLRHGMITLTPGWEGAFVDGSATTRQRIRFESGGILAFKLGGAHDEPPLPSKAQRYLTNGLYLDIQICTVTPQSGLNVFLDLLVIVRTRDNVETDCISAISNPWRCSDKSHSR